MTMVIAGSATVKATPTTASKNMLALIPRVDAICVCGAAMRASPAPPSQETTAMSEVRDFEAEAVSLLRHQMLRNPDPAIRLIAATFDPPPESVARVAAAIRAKWERDNIGNDSHE